MVEDEFAEELKRRRAEVLRALSGDVLVLFSAPVLRRNGDVEHPYRQNSDFFYLSGFEEPESVLVLREGPPSFILFVRERDPEREQWDGRRAGIEGATQAYGADAAYPIQELEGRLPDLLENVDGVHYLMGEEGDWDRQVIRAITLVKGRRRKLVTAPSRIVDAARVLHDLRRLKSPYEVQRLEDVAELTAAAHRRAMQVCRPGMKEYQLQAALEEVFHQGGARRCAYESIVGSGDNATILHYRENDREMAAGDLVLIDAGAELAFMAADITRTFPVSGRFSEAQRELYALVLRAHARAIECVRPGNTLEDVHAAALEVIHRGLMELGWIDSSAPKEEQDKALRRYFMHKTSHYLGMDVHDVGPYHRGGSVLPLEPGVVLTVEPGLYVSRGDPVAPEKYWSIGIRIEDDVLVEQAGARVLTSSVPREIDEIEGLMATAASD